MRRNAKNAPIIRTDRLDFTTFSIEANFNFIFSNNSVKFRIVKRWKMSWCICRIVKWEEIVQFRYFFTFSLWFLNDHFSTVLHLDKLLLIGSSVNDLIVLSVSHWNLNQINQLGQTNQIQINQGDPTNHTILALTAYQIKTSNKINRIQINRAVQVTNRVDLDGVRKSTTSWENI